MSHLLKDVFHGALQPQIFNVFFIFFNFLFWFFKRHGFLVVGYLLPRVFPMTLHKTSDCDYVTRYFHGRLKRLVFSPLNSKLYAVRLVQTPTNQMKFHHPGKNQKNQKKKKTKMKAIRKINGMLAQQLANDQAIRFDSANHFKTEVRKTNALFFTLNCG